MRGWIRWLPGLQTLRSYDAGWLPADLVAGLVLTTMLVPDSSLAAVIIAVVLPLSAGDPMRAVAVASLMAVVSGLVCILVGVMRLGFVTELLSKPIRYGYMNGIALTVLISQLPKLFGFSIESEGPVRNLFQIAESILGGKANWTAFAVGAVTLVVILALKPWKKI